MNTLFYFFSSFALMSGIMVIQSRNPVHSVLFLILVFFNSAGLLLLLGLDFFAMIFLVVYVGAIAVLFLFVVMMLNVKLAEINEKRLRYLPIGGLLGFLFLLEIFLIVDNDLIPLIVIGNSAMLSSGTDSVDALCQVEFVQWFQLTDTYSNIESIGLLIYTYYFLFFLLASLILLVAMIGAIVLTMHKGIYIKRQQVFQQNTREFAKTVIKLN
jgi:NADH-ubiquinone oxidoreductase chain 6